MKNPHDESIDANAHKYRYGANFEKRARREHYEKYAARAAYVQEGEAAVLMAISYSVEQLREAFLADRHLNNISLFQWDCVRLHMKPETPADLRRWTPAELVCTAKHIAVYHILKVEPPPEEWKHLPDEGIDNLNRMLWP